ncbi:MAG: serine hydrolase [Bacteroidales bacterium]|nr:serine hydrolase [Bacteroidales bacterium]
MKKTGLLAAIIIFSAFTCLKAQVPQFISDSLQAVLELHQGSNSIPGISAAVNIYGIGTWQGTSGDSHSGTDITPEMIMGLGSNTKTFTAVFVMRLVEQTILSLEDSLHQWLPNYSNVDSTATIKQLLQHTSGIADYFTYAFGNAITSNTNHIFTPEEVLTYIGEPIFPPGTGVHYSNTNYLLAGMIIETALNKTYASCIRDSILTPLNLNNTFLEGFETVNGTMAHPWDQGIDIYQMPRIALGTGAYAAGCMVSTPLDMVNWYNQLFSQNFLSDNSIESMTEFINISSSLYNGIGLGLFEVEHDSKIYWGHAGNTFGYISFTLYDTEDKHLISIIRNSTNAEIKNIIKGLASALNDLVVTSLPDLSYSKSNDIFRNYPNPFSSSTTIEYEVKDHSKISLEIYDILGNKIKTLVEGYQTDGNKTVIWDGTNNSGQTVPAGVYCCRIQIDEEISCFRKIIKH